LPWRLQQRSARRCVSQDFSLDVPRGALPGAKEEPETKQEGEDHGDDREPDEDPVQETGRTHLPTVRRGGKLLYPA